MGVTRKKEGYGWAAAAGLNALSSFTISFKALSFLQATVTNFATNFLSSGVAGFLLFKETLSAQWFAGALLIVIGVVILSKSSIEQKASID